MIKAPKKPETRKEIPEYNKKSFKCPKCGAFAAFTWHPTIIRNSENNEIGSSLFPTLAQCNACNNYTIWRSYLIKYSTKTVTKWHLVWPQNSTAPFPLDDMPNVILDDYNEARDIVNNSPRGAAAILRLTIEKLLIELTGKKKNTISENIQLLIDKGLNNKIANAFDIVRIIGSEAVHPGQVDLKDDEGMAINLFHLVNIIVQEQITDLNLVNNMNKKIPDNKKEGIVQRQKKSDKKQTVP